MLYDPKIVGYKLQTLNCTQFEMLIMIVKHFNRLIFFLIFGTSYIINIFYVIQIESSIQLTLKLDKWFVCLFLARQPPSGPGPPHSRGF